VRELENAVRRAATLESSTVIEVENLPEAVRRAGAGSDSPPPQGGTGADAGGASPETADAGDGAPRIPAEGIDLEEHLESIRRAYMLRALEEAGGVQKKAAARLGMSFRSFRYYLGKLGLRDDDDAGD
jgi:two-component system response regulator PilR (NtrC family)